MRLRYAEKLRRLADPDLPPSRVTFTDAIELMTRYNSACKASDTDHAKVGFFKAFQLLEKVSKPVAVLLGLRDLPQGLLLRRFSPGSRIYSQTSASYAQMIAALVRFWYGSHAWHPAYAL